MGSSTPAIYGLGSFFAPSFFNMSTHISTCPKNEGAKKASKTIDIVSYALEVSVNGVTCVFVVHVRSSDTFNICKLA